MVVDPLELKKLATRERALQPLRFLTSAVCDEAADLTLTRGKFQRRQKNGESTSR